MQLLKMRMNRATYWVGFLTFVLIFAAMNFVGARPPAIGELAIVYLSVPRLHDVGRSGWWVLVPLLVEVVPMIVGVALLPRDDFYVLVGAVALIILAMLILLGLLPGQPETNRWGDPPPPGLRFKKHTEKVEEIFK